MVFDCKPYGIRYTYIFLLKSISFFRLMEKGFRMLFYCKYLVKWNDYTVVSLFRKTVQKYPQKAMLINCASGKEWTYSEVRLFNAI